MMIPTIEDKVFHQDPRLFGLSGLVYKSLAIGAKQRSSKQCRRSTVLFELATEKAMIRSLLLLELPPLARDRLPREVHRSQQPGGIADLVASGQ